MGMSAHPRAYLRPAHETQLADRIRQHPSILAAAQNAVANLMSDGVTGGLDFTLNPEVQALIEAGGLPECGPDDVTCSFTDDDGEPRPMEVRIDVKGEPDGTTGYPLVYMEWVGVFTIQTKYIFTVWLHAPDIFEICGEEILLDLDSEDAYDEDDENRAEE